MTEVKKYQKITVIEHWIFIISILGLIATGLPPFLNWFLPDLSIYDVYIPVVPTISFWLGPLFISFDHNFFGLILICVSIVHVIAHVGSKDNAMLTTPNEEREVRSIIHAFFYFFGLFKKEERGGGKKIKARQRSNYISLIFSIGLLMITGLMLYYYSYFDFIAHETILFTHVIASFTLILILIVHLAFILRNHDLVTLRCMLLTGKVPLDYVRREHKVWYSDIKEEKKHQPSGYVAQDTVEKIAVELLRFYQIDYDAEDVKMLAENIKRECDAEELARIREIANVI